MFRNNRKHNVSATMFPSFCLGLTKENSVFCGPETEVDRQFLFHSYVFAAQFFFKFHQNGQVFLTVKQLFPYIKY